MNTFTDHKLTNAQLRRLSQIVNGRPNKFGNALDAISRKGLITERVDGVSDRRYGKDCFYIATYAGHVALEQARKEGW